MAERITELGPNHRIIVDDTANTWKLQFYDSAAGVWKDIIGYDTSGQKITTDLDVNKDIPATFLRGTETNAKTLALRENAGRLELRNETDNVTVGLYPKQSATKDVTIPVGGGSTAFEIYFSNLTGISYIANVQITNADPDTSDIYFPRNFNVVGNTLQLTGAAATGTTLTFLAEAIGEF